LRKIRYDLQAMNHVNSGGADRSGLLQASDALIIVAPFNAADQAALGPHILQGRARQAGMSLSVFYANIWFASLIGIDTYDLIYRKRGYTGALFGERLFARAAFGLPPLGRWAESMFDPRHICPEAPQVQQSLFVTEMDGCERLDIDELVRFERLATDWVEEAAALISSKPWRVVGASCIFEQRNASIAILKRVKDRIPDVVTVMGGTNASPAFLQSDAIDYVFMGESDLTFPRFLQDLAVGQRPEARVVNGEPLQDLDSSPCPDFSEYVAQRDHFLPPTSVEGHSRIVYETSRGCSWGTKRQCHFCGEARLRSGPRIKSADKVLSDLRTLAERHPALPLIMTDIDMPYQYLRTLFPMLGRAKLSLKLGYQIRPNLSLKQALTLRGAGDVALFAGIEAFSPKLLSLMNKEPSVRSRLMTLRYVLSVRMAISWHLLWGIPGDDSECYDETLALLPLLRHLPPPNAMYHVALPRDSPFVGQPGRFGIRDLRPIESFGAVLPDDIDAREVAYTFYGNYECGAHRDLETIRNIDREIETWRDRWFGEAEAAVMYVMRVGERFLLLDTRGVPGTKPAQVLDRAQASRVLVATPDLGLESVEWALDNKLGVIIEDWYLPLAVAAPELLAEFEAEAREGRPRLTPAQDLGDVDHSFQ